MTDTSLYDFQTYWRQTLDELERVPAAPEVEPLPMRSTDYAEMYAVKMTSVGPYRLYAYLSVPNGDGPFPAIYYTPKYQSVLEPIPQGSPNRLRSRFVTFALAARGQRNADKPFAAQFPGLLTERIHDAASYIFRGIAADSARGLEYLLTRPEVDAERVAAVGNDTALITAALCPGITHIVCTPALFVDTAELAPRAADYPLEEINDYLNLYPNRKDAVGQTLSYFQLSRHAPAVSAQTLLMAGAAGSLLDANALSSVSSALGGAVEVFESQSSSYKDGMHSERWLAEQFGFDAPILPEHWQ